MKFINKFNKKSNPFFIAQLCIYSGLLVLIVLILIFQVYTVFVQKEGDAALPPLFGNFSENRRGLERDQTDAAFSFAVVGDTKSVGTFERITRELRNQPLDFAFLLGDCTYKGTEWDHRYFRAECADEYALPFNVFYVVGNHDVSPDSFPIRRFEDVYGPSNFSFEYRNCLFIVLRILDPPFNNAESLEYLAGFKQIDLGRYAHTFVFFHIPPPVSQCFHARAYQDSDRLIELLSDLDIEYVFAGDFHGYAQSRSKGTTHIVTGGGGAHLAGTPGNQFHHAVVVSVSPDSVDSRIVFVPAAEDLEDRLEKLAISDVWPWMQRHPSLLLILDTLLFVMLALLSLAFITLWKRHVKPSQGA